LCAASSFVARSALQALGDLVQRRRAEVDAALFQDGLRRLRQPAGSGRLEHEPELGECNRREPRASGQHHIGCCHESLREFGVRRADLQRPSSLIGLASIFSLTGHLALQVLCPEHLGVRRRAAHGIRQDGHVRHGGVVARDDLGGPEMDRFETGQLGDRAAQGLVFGQQLVDALAAVVEEFLPLLVQLLLRVPGGQPGLQLELDRQSQ
jgi:hypothetical protein